MAGIGMQKFGATSFGFGTSDAASAAGGAFLRDATTGKSLGARRIDPRTKDFYLDTANGRILGVDPVRHAVQMSIHTEYATSAVQAVGQRLKSIERVSGNFERRVLAVLTEALQPLITAGYVEVLGFVAFKAGDNRNGIPRGATYGRLLWKDLTTKQTQKEFV